MWSLHGLWHAWVDMLQADGNHLNLKGNLPFFKHSDGSISAWCSSSVMWPIGVKVKFALMDTLFEDKLTIKAHVSIS